VVAAVPKAEDPVCAVPEVRAVREAFVGRPEGTEASPKADLLEVLVALAVSARKAAPVGREVLAVLEAPVVSRAVSADVARAA